MGETPARPRVSVIMPFYNLERFLEESIESVVDQTYSHWELLLVDDGSTDGSTGIARRYSRAHPDRIRYLTFEDRRNRGASAARNLGLRHARGEFIALLDGDDVWLPHKLEQQVQILDEHPEVGSLIGRTLYWYSWTGLPRDRRRDFLDHRTFPANAVLQPPAVLVANLTGKAAVPGTCSLLARRSAVEAIGGFEERFTHLYTDQVFYAKLFLYAPVYAAAACWDKYRRHPTSAVSSAEQGGQLEAWRLEYLEWFRRYTAAETGGAHPELEAALRRALRPYRHPHLHRVIDAPRRVGEALGGWFWNRIVPMAFGAARLLLPRRLRDTIWTRWSEYRRRRR